MDTTQKGKKEYQEMVKKTSPNSKLLANCTRAFVAGGIICCIGQFFNNMFANMGYTLDETSMITSVILIFLAAVLTGFGLYEKIGKWAGAGSIVPITGFSNSMVAPALEFKKEGFVTGVGAKLFIVAGPVIVYGIATSVIVGIIYSFIR